MHKTPIRGHAAQAASLQVSLPDVHCRDLERELQDHGNKARLRGSLQLGFLTLRPRRSRDSLFRRAFRREAIGTEKLVARAALASAASNLTPTRLGQLGSPGQRAVQALYDASAAGMQHDIRVGQVRSAIALLAGVRKKRSFRVTPVKTQPSRLAQNGATGLTSADSIRRVQLNRFCMDSAASGSLLVLLAGAAETRDTIAASLAIFRAAVQSFILEAVMGGKPASQEGIARQVRKGMDSQLLRLFLALWRRAAAVGKIGGNVFPWFDVVDWLVDAMQGVRPTSPGATRAPKSPRVRSTAALLLRQAQAAAPPTVTASISSSTSRPGRPSRHLRSRTLTVARTGDADPSDSPFKAAAQPGRQGHNVQLQYRAPAPEPLADSPVAAPGTAATAPSHGAPQDRCPMPAVDASLDATPDMTSDSPISPGGHVLPGATLGDIVHHLVRQASAAPGTPGPLDRTEADSSASVRSPDIDQ